MRLITDEQHAQIVDALSDERYVSQYSHIVETLATLQALPEVEVVAHVDRENLEYLKTRHGDESTQLRYANGFPKWVPSYVQENYLPLYATKEPS